MRFFGNLIKRGNFHFSARNRVVVISILLLPIFLFMMRTEVIGAGKVYGVAGYIIDGDSLIVMVDGSELEVRLWGIDSPEYNQPGAEGSRTALRSFVLKEKVMLDIKYQDRYGREVAVLYCNGKNINEEMVATGNSWVYDYYCRELICRTWQQLQVRARQKGYGLWNLKNPIAPWQWKKKQ